MHAEPIPADHPGHRYRGSMNRPQGDGRKGLAHGITAVFAIVVSLLAANFTSIAKGPQGQPGTTTVITKPVVESYGVCAYFGPDKTGRLRFQVSTPQTDKSGPWCPHGTYVSVVPATKG